MTEEEGEAKVSALGISSAAKLRRVDKSAKSYCKLLQKSR